MKEVSRLLSFKQLVTTPYHPICNGLVEQNGNEALMERQPTEDGRKTVCIYQERKVGFCNISDECKTSPDDSDRKDVLVWIFSFMAMMVMKMASCIGQWTCTLGEISGKVRNVAAKESEDGC